MPPITQDHDMLRRHVTGKQITSYQILGINSLKTLIPSAESTVGQTIIDLIADNNFRRVDLILTEHAITVDLARTGTMLVLHQATTWKPSDKTPMPTARVIFTDGTGVDFKEPAKTKRITFTIREIDQK